MVIRKTASYSTVAQKSQLAPPTGIPDHSLLDQNQSLAPNPMDMPVNPTRNHKRDPAPEEVGFMPEVLSPEQDENIPVTELDREQQAEEPPRKTWRDFLPSNTMAKSYGTFNKSAKANWRWSLK